MVRSQTRHKGSLTLNWKVGLLYFKYFLRKVNTGPTKVTKAIH